MRCFTHGFLLLAGSWILLATPALAAPVLTGINPSSGNTEGGNTITITGRDFGSAQGVVRVGNNGCAVTDWTETQALCTAPEGAGATREVSVTVPGGAVGGITVGGAVYRYNAPTVMGVNPLYSPPSGGVRLTLTGSNFGPAGVATVRVGSADCPVTSDGTHTRLVCSVPPGAGSQDIVVDVAGQVTTAPTTLTYAPIPSITSVNPSSGPTAGGYTLTLQGNHFGGGSSVKVGGQPCVTTVDSDTEVQCTVPEGQGSQVDLVLVTTKGPRAASTFAFLPPRLDAVSAAAFPTAGNVPITLTGSDFGVSSVVHVGEATCDVASQGHARLICTLPPGTGTQRAVSVQASDQASLDARTLSYDAPVVAGVEPASSRTAGGALITLTGQNFGSAQGSVTVGGADCPVQTQEDARVTCTVPPGAGAEASVVVSVAGQPSEPAAFGYLPPSVDGISPSHGPAAGGFTITITGDNFGAARSKARVGGVTCPVVEQEHTRVTCTVPPGTGVVEADVEVGGQRSAPAVFTYDSDASASSSSSAAASSGGGMASSRDEGGSSNGMGSGSSMESSSTAEMRSSSAGASFSSSEVRSSSTPQNASLSSSNGVIPSSGSGSAASTDNSTTEPALCRCARVPLELPLMAPALLLMALFRRRR
jgi:hypothetical protein